ncbi:ABC transporter ATP-binding protein [Candidatus Sumerlaeota bacterium]|nr:ABC transporter ATP-binding protein [Candidatus Sumerlaeota bacterium]
MSPPGGGSSSHFDEAELGKVFDLHLARRLWPFLRPYRRLVFFAVFLSILTALLRIVGPWIARHIIDAFLPPDTPERQAGLNQYVLLYIGFLGVMFVANMALSYTTAWVGQRAMYDLRGTIFGKLQTLSLKFFDRTPSGRLLTRTTSDVQVLNEFFAQGVVNIFADVVLLVGIILVWFWFDPRLALLLFVSGPLLGIAAYNFRIRARSVYRAVRVRLAALNAFLQESLAGVRTVQAFNCEKAVQRRYRELNSTYRDAQIQTVRHFARFVPTVEIVSMLSMVTVLAYGAWRADAIRGTGQALPIQAGDFYMYFQYIVWFFMPIRDLAEKYNVFQGAMASAERIFVLLDEPVDVEDPPEPAPIAPLSEGIELRNVWFSYNTDEWILKDVSLRVAKGQTAALVGATGAGKSTVINLITRLYDVQKGQILFDGRDLRQFAQAELRRRMAIVLQDVFLFSGTVADNIRLGNRDISDEQVERAARYVNAHPFISRLPGGYRHEVQERGATFSTGQKQLLAFARAVAFDPDILILDEATANIDTETEALIQDALAKLMRDRTCIVVAHRLSTIQKAHKITVFSHGRIHEEGTHQELLRRDGLYRRLYELQYKV